MRDSASIKTCQNRQLSAYYAACICNETKNKAPLTAKRQRITEVNNALHPGYFSGFRTWGCEPTLGAPPFPSSPPLSLSFPFLLPLLSPSPPLEVGLEVGPLKSS